VNRREFGGLGLAALWAGRAWAGDWALVLAQAKGQEVFFHAWGGDPKISAFIAWVGEEAAARESERKNDRETEGKLRLREIERSECKIRQRKCVVEQRGK
jgi:hypothetical protein